MTTPPTPAGWYPDPDGSGGQRYWDGSEWTEHRAPATPEPAEPPATTEPPGSEQPTTVVPLAGSEQPTTVVPLAGSEQPTTVVPLAPSGNHVGAHRAPDSTPEPEAAPPSEPESARA